MSEHPWIKRGPYPGPEHTGMPIPDDPIVGHTTFRDGHHEPLRQSEAEAIIAASDKAKARRQEEMPDEQSAITAMFSAWLRLKELGWREAQYCPKDGQLFDAIEPGSTGIHRCRYEGQWPSGGWWIVGDDDLYPSRPVLFRQIGSGTQPTEEQADATRRSEAQKTSSSSHAEVAQSVEKLRRELIRRWDTGFESTHDAKDYLDRLVEAVRAEQQQEIELALDVLKPSMRSSGLVDACKQRMQAYISCEDNYHFVERKLAEAEAQITALTAQRDQLKASEVNLIIALEEVTREAFIQHFGASAERFVRGQR